MAMLFQGLRVAEGAASFRVFHTRRTPLDNLSNSIMNTEAAFSCDWPSAAGTKAPLNMLMLFRNSERAESH